MRLLALFVLIVTASTACTGTCGEHDDTALPEHGGRVFPPSADGGSSGDVATGPVPALPAGDPFCFRPNPCVVDRLVDGHCIWDATPFNLNPSATECCAGGRIYRELEVICKTDTEGVEWLYICMPDLRPGMTASWVGSSCPEWMHCVPQRFEFCEPNPPYCDDDSAGKNCNDGDDATTDRCEANMCIHEHGADGGG